MKDLISKMLAGRSVVLVGPTNSGKTSWVRETLIPELESDGLQVVYFEDASRAVKTYADVVIFDEVETFFDREYLEKKHPDETPYYSEDYIRKVHSWHNIYGTFRQPALYIITRNSEEEIDYLVKNFKVTDWDKREIESIKFEI